MDIIVVVLLVVLAVALVAKAAVPFGIDIVEEPEPEFADLFERDFWILDRFGCDGCNRPGVYVLIMHDRGMPVLGLCQSCRSGKPHALGERPVEVIPACSGPYGDDDIPF